VASDGELFSPIRSRVSSPLENDSPEGTVADTYTVKLLEQQTCGADIRILRFERPAGYAYKSGQWFRLSLDTAQGPETKTFSHCSAPGDSHIEMATRMSDSAFKQALGAISPGMTVRIAGPGGRFALPADTQRVAFLVGGVGITPVRSLLRNAMQTGREFADALLLYGNRDESCAPFLAEFEAMRSIGVRVVVCYERPSVGWEGESGFITEDTVRRHMDPSDGRLFVVTGPPVMVEAMESVLSNLAVPAERRLVERFSVKT
jgi:glycine betaine catabolism B